ncbi:MAG: hypothetical protein ACPGVY_11350 [Mycobacterium sp.]
MATRKKQATGGYDFAVVRDNLAKQELGVTFPLLGSDGEPQPYGDGHVTLTVRGERSATFRQMADEFDRTYYDDVVKIKDPVERDEAFKQASLDRPHAFDMKVRAPNVIGWVGFTDGGKPVELTIELARELMDTPGVREQIVNAQGDPERFFVEASAG